MTYRNLDEFLIRLEQSGELKTVRKTIQSDHQLAQVANTHDEALLFQSVEGRTLPVVVNLFKTPQRMAWALGLDNLDALDHRLKRLLDPTMPRSLSDLMSRAGELMTMFRTGSSGGSRNQVPMAQQIIHRDIFDLRQLPALRVWQRDSLSWVDGAQIVVGGGDRVEPRVQYGAFCVVDAHTLAVEWPDAESGDGPLPVAVVLGGDPAQMWAASVPLPERISPHLLAGWLRSKPVSYARCVSHDLEVLTNAELVIEGWLHPERRIDAGLRGSRDGFYRRYSALATIEVTAVTQREQAVVPVILPADRFMMQSVSERLLLPMLSLVMSDLHDLHVRDELVVASVKRHFPGHAQRTMFGLWGIDMLMHSRALVITDTDTDIRDLRSLTTQILQRVDWACDALWVSGPVDACNVSTNRVGVGGKVGIDATGAVMPEIHLTASQRARMTARFGDTWSEIDSRLCIVQGETGELSASPAELMDAVWVICPQQSVLVLDPQVPLLDFDAVFREVMYCVDWQRDTLLRKSGELTVIGIDATHKDVGRGLPERVENTFQLTNTLIAAKDEQKPRRKQ